MLAAVNCVMCTSAKCDRQRLQEICKCVTRTDLQLTQRAAIGSERFGQPVDIGQAGARHATIIIGATLDLQRHLNAMLSRRRRR